MSAAKKKAAAVSLTRTTKSACTSVVNLLRCRPPKKVARTPLAPAGAIPAINEGINGCWPASVARSLTYMFGQAVLKETPQEVYNALSKKMKTDTKKGTIPVQGLAGKEEYVKEKKLSLKSKLLNFKEGIGQALKVVKQGGDVEMGIHWVPSGGHRAMVVSIVERRDDKKGNKVTGYEITYVDDPVQGDGIAQNQEHVIQTDTEGKVTAGANATVASFLVEKKKKAKEEER